MANGTINDALKQLEADGLIIRLRSTFPGQAKRRTYYVMEFDFARLEEQTPEAGGSADTCSSPPPERLAPDSARADSGAKEGKLRQTGEKPVSNPKEKKVCGADAETHTHSHFEEFWEVYPRSRGLNASRRLFAQAEADGNDPSMMIEAAKAYAKENEGNARQYLAFSTSWLR